MGARSAASWRNGSRALPIYAAAFFVAALIALGITRTAQAAAGDIGYEGRMEYGAVGNVVNLAARLASEAKGGQILTNQKTLGRLGPGDAAEPLGEIHVRGFAHPVAAFNLLDQSLRTAP